MVFCALICSDPCRTSRNHHLKTSKLVTHLEICWCTLILLIIGTYPSQPSIIRVFSMDFVMPPPFCWGLVPDPFHWVGMSSIWPELLGWKYSIFHSVLLNIFNTPRSSFFVHFDLTDYICICRVLVRWL